MKNSISRVPATNEEFTAAIISLPDYELPGITQQDTTPSDFDLMMIEAEQNRIPLELN